jgi:hypothetical protein
MLAERKRLKLSKYKWFGFVLVPLIICAITLFSPSRCAYACSCTEPESPQVQLQKSVAVFKGKVVNIERPSNVGDAFASPVKITFDVSESWKGTSNKTLVVDTNPDGASCGFSFKQGQEYLVYANGTTTDLVTTICTRTRTIGDANEDLSVLGKGTIPVQNTATTTAPTPTATQSDSGFNFPIFIPLIIVGMSLFIGFGFFIFKFAFDRNRQ